MTDKRVHFVGDTFEGPATLSICLLPAVGSMAQEEWRVGIEEVNDDPYAEPHFFIFDTPVEADARAIYNKYLNKDTIVQEEIEDDGFMYF